MLAELHLHTRYSQGTKIIAEGMNTPGEMVKQAKKLGIGAIAFTDHDSIKANRYAKSLQKKYGVVVIPGEEISSRDGHILGLGLNELVKPGLSVEETLDKIHQQGGIGIAAHPFDVAKKGLGKLAKECDAVEVFNAQNVERIANWKCERFAKKYRLPTVAGSDTHWTKTMGYGLTEIKANSVSGVLKAIKKGDTKLVCRYLPGNLIMDWTVERLKLSYGYTVDYMNKNYSWPKRAVGTKMIRLVKRSPGSVDYFFRFLGYFALASVILYGGVREITGI